jgi:hypothetical protein
MAVVAGLFDSEADATKAMDRLLTEGLEDLETTVYGGGAGDGSSVVLFPGMPNTSGQAVGNAPGSLPFAVASNEDDFNWFGDFDEIERAFYHEGVRDGATIAMAKVHDEDVNRVRLIFTMFNGRSFVKE